MSKVDRSDAYRFVLLALFLRNLQRGKYASHLLVRYKVSNAHFDLNGIC